MVQQEAQPMALRVQQIVVSPRKENPHVSIWASYSSSSIRLRWIQLTYAGESKRHTSSHSTFDPLIELPTLLQILRIIKPVLLASQHA